MYHTPSSYVNFIGPKVLIDVVVILLICLSGNGNCQLIFMTSGKTLGSLGDAVAQPRACSLISDDYGTKDNFSLFFFSNHTHFQNEHLFHQGNKDITLHAFSEGRTLAEISKHEGSFTHLSKDG